MKRIIFILLSIYAISASSEVLGSWSVNYSISGYQIASTSNGADAEAGVLCALSNEKCATYFAPPLLCKEGAKYPVMINSKSGAYTMNASCIHIGNLHVLLFDDYETIVNVFNAGSLVGFALPIDGGAFQVFRFSTNGAAQAIKKAQEITSPNTPTSSTKRFESL